MGLFDFLIGVEYVYKHVSNEDLYEMVSEKEANALNIIDVRTKGEYLNGHIPNAQNLNVMGPNFIKQIETLDKSKTYYIICASGNRSKTACGILSRKGFENVYNVKGGMMDWQGPIE